MFEKKEIEFDSKAKREIIGDHPAVNFYNKKRSKKSLDRCQ